MSRHGNPPRHEMDPNQSTESPPDGDVTIDLLIETLTGTAFEMTVSPLDTVAAIKNKIFRIEGIPVSAQHLLFNSRELDDSACLSDCSIRDGATLKLVTSMRGGPISTRRMVPSNEERAWMDLVDSNRCDKLLERLPSGQLTVLVFCEGEHMNLFRVVENTDGTYTPIADAINRPSSLRSASSVAEEPEAAAKRLQENSVTMEKMQSLQRKLNESQRRKLRAYGSDIEGVISPLPVQNPVQVEEQSTVDSKLHLLSHPQTEQASQNHSVLEKKCSGQTTEHRHVQVANTGMCLRNTGAVKKSVCLPALQRMDSTQQKNFSSSPSKSFLPPLSVCESGKKDVSILTASSQRYRQPIRISSSVSPSLRPSAPSQTASAHVSTHFSTLLRRAQPQRVQASLRQRAAVLPELRQRSVPPLSKEAQTTLPKQLPSLQPSMCQTSPKLDLNCSVDSRESKSSTSHKRPINMTLSPVEENREENPQTSSENQQQTDVSSYDSSSDEFNLEEILKIPPDASPLTLMRRPPRSPKERFAEHLADSLAQSFQTRFPGLLPPQLPLRLAYRLTDRLSHRFSEGLSDETSNQLSQQLSTRITEALESCLSGQTAEDFLSEALSFLLQVRTAQGYRFIRDSSGKVRTGLLMNRSRSTRSKWMPASSELKVRRGQTALPIFSVDTLGVQDPSEEGACSSSIESILPVYAAGADPQDLPVAKEEEDEDDIHCSNPIQKHQSDIAKLVAEIQQLDAESRTRSSQSANRCQIGYGTSHQEPLSLSVDDANLTAQKAGTCDKAQQTITTFSPSSVTIAGVSKPNQDSGDEPLVESKATVVEGVVKMCDLLTPEKETIQALETSSPIPNATDVCAGDALHGEGKSPKKPHRRCSQCRKKLTISNKYICRCQKLFCSVHRYSEAHSCSYDYKEEGRKLLQQENPLVTAQKIAKM